MFCFMNILFLMTKLANVSSLKSKSHSSWRSAAGYHPLGREKFVCCPNKSIYGLEQERCNWFTKLRNSLLSGVTLNQVSKFLHWKEQKLDKA